jgi:uncharacterized membrane protein
MNIEGSPPRNQNENGREVPSQGAMSADEKLSAVVTTAASGAVMGALFGGGFGALLGGIGGAVVGSMVTPSMHEK